MNLRMLNEVQVHFEILEALKRQDFKIFNTANY